jgi:hypothetical protein
VLDQATTVVHVQKLKPAADRQDGQIPFECFPEEGTLDGVSLIVQRFRFRLPHFSVQRRVNICSTG